MIDDDGVLPWGSLSEAKKRYRERVADDPASTRGDTCFPERSDDEWALEREEPFEGLSIQERRRREDQGMRRLRWLRVRSVETSCWFRPRPVAVSPPGPS